jgi:CopZ-like zinc binding protein
METTLADACCSVPEAGCETCELPSEIPQNSRRVSAACPVCHHTGKPVQGQTVKALLSVTLRSIQNVEYHFCQTEACPVVYFSADGTQTFSREHVREQVYQKESQADDVWVCYCFRHTVGKVRNASDDESRAILHDIDTGIQAGQCACDLRNPQGSCCLGNVVALIKKSAQPQHTSY